MGSPAVESDAAEPAADFMEGCTPAGSNPDPEQNTSSGDADPIEQSKCISTEAVTMSVDHPGTSFTPHSEGAAGVTDASAAAGVSAASAEEAGAEKGTFEASPPDAAVATAEPSSTEPDAAVIKVGAPDIAAATAADAAKALAADSDFVEGTGMEAGGEEVPEGEAPEAAGEEVYEDEYYEEFEPRPATEVEVTYRQIDPLSEGMTPVQINEDLTLYIGRVPDDAAARLLGSDMAINEELVPGLYEGGYHLWDCSMDLCKYLHKTFKLGKMLETTEVCPELQGKRILELGCGHGLPGITMLMAGADVHFHDYNQEVLKEYTVGNALANLQRLPVGRPRPSVRFFSGDWFFTGEFLTARGFGGHYDIIMASEGIYDLDSQYHLLECIKQVLQPPHGHVYIASQYTYPNIGAGTETFRELVKKDGIFEVTSCLKEEDPKTGGYREIIKLAFPISIVPYFL